MGISPGSGDPGQGTGTLEVRARVEAEASTDNAQDPSQFETEMRVRVTREGSPVEGATVKVGSSAGTLTLEASEDPGSYSGSQSGYWRSYTLEVRAGADSVTGVRLDGPLAHSFSSPTKGSVHPAGQPLEVLWAPTGADEAYIETHELSSRTVADSGAYTVSGGYLSGDGEEGSDRVRLTRLRRLGLAGGAPGSTLTVSVRNEVEFTVRNLRNNEGEL